MKLFSLISAGAVLCLAAGSWQLYGQTTAVSATVRFGNGQTVVIADFSDQIGVQPGEVVSVTIQFAPNHAGEAIKVGSLDGGLISNSGSSGSGVVAGDGSLTFTFRAPANAGLDRIVIRGVSKTLRMQFWVLDPANPQNNPPVITPANPEA